MVIVGIIIKNPDSLMLSGFSFMYKTNQNVPQSMTI